MAWEEYRDAVHHCREITHKTKVQLELKLTNTAEDNKKVFLKYINNKRRTRDNTALLFDEDELLTNKESQKSRHF